MCDEIIVTIKNGGGSIHPHSDGPVVNRRDTQFSHQLR